MQRKVLWKERQLFFCTPQTFRNDIAKGYVDVRKIVCLVFDEAHRASGNYAYTVVTQQIIQQNLKKNFLKYLKLKDVFLELMGLLD